MKYIVTIFIICITAIVIGQSTDVIYQGGNGSGGSFGQSDIVCSMYWGGKGTNVQYGNVVGEYHCPMYNGGVKSGSSFDQGGQSICVLYNGGTHSGVNSSYYSGMGQCNMFYGGDYNGSVTEILHGANCNMFLGGEFSGYSHEENAWANCFMFAGGSHSGYQEEFYSQPNSCIYYRSSVSAGDGYTSDMLSNYAEVCVVLPLSTDLSPLTGNLKNTVGMLYWESYTELNVAQYKIFKSIDGFNWSQIGTVAAKGVNGKGCAYSYQDKFATEEHMYYKVSMVKFDGGSVFTNILPLGNGEGNVDQLFVLFPNPVNKNSDLKLRSYAMQGRSYHVKVLNSIGIVLYESVFDIGLSGNEVTIPISTLVGGFYELTIEWDGGKSNEHIPFVVIN